MRGGFINLYFLWVSWGRMNIKILKTLIIAVFFSLIGVGSASAYPALQLFIEGSTYDETTETWTITDGVFDLWIIGDVGRIGTIYEVKLAAVFWGDAGTFTLTPKTTSLITDPSVSDVYMSTSVIDNPTLWSTGTGSNDPLPDHGIYNDPTVDHWDNYLLGDFSLIDSEIGDYMTDFPSTFDSYGQVNVYEVAITGWDRVHFDAMDHTVMSIAGGTKEKVKQWIAPFSHDASHVVPEPGTFILLGGGLVGVAFLRKRLKKA